MPETPTLDADPHSKFEHYYADYKINEDGTIGTTDQTWPRHHSSRKTPSNGLKQGFDHLQHQRREGRYRGSLYAQAGRQDASTRPRIISSSRSIAGRTRTRPPFPTDTTLTVIFSRCRRGRHGSAFVLQGHGNREPMFPKRFSFIQAIFPAKILHLRIRRQGEASTCRFR